MKKLLVALLTLVMLTGCSGSTNKYNVGVIQLVQHDALDSATQGFVDCLKDEFGDDINIDVQVASGDSAVCSTMATNFVAEGVDLIMANATPALQATSHATDTIPILGTSVTEYGVALDIDNFNGIVGNNVSGTSDLAPLDEQAQMIIDLVPDAKVVGMLYCSSEANSLYQVKKVQEYLEAKGLTVKSYSFSDSNDVSSVATSACQETDVIYIPTDNTCASNGEVIKSAAMGNVPIIVGEKACCKAVGGVATLSIDYYELGKTTGQMAIKILKGEAKVEEMPIEYFASPVKSIDKEVAESFNIAIPDGYELMD
ncbi:MAG: ABC transporter substrate-binding protein [Erysipelotrichaceae bacterium]|nr:ABC transporter substrate-binding protein [Erysipelotrichaceae bacterium]